MRIPSRVVHTAVLALAFLTAGRASAALPEFDVTFATAPATRLSPASRAATVVPGARVQGMDERFGVPSFVWGTSNPTPAAARSTGVRGVAATDAAARAQFGALAPLYGLGRDDVAGATLSTLHDAGNGSAIATYRMELDGVPVFRESFKVCVDGAGRLVAAAGSLPSRGGAPATSAARAAAFALDGARATALALADFAALPAAPAIGAVLGEDAGGFVRFAAPEVLTRRDDGLAVARDLRARRVWFRLPESLEPAWYVEVMAETAAYAYVLSARDGRLLFRHSLMNDVAFGYRVWANGLASNTPMDGPQGDAPSPHPTGLPNLYNPSLVAPSLVSLQNGPISTNDPWLAPGAVQTLGNNVDAYVDFNSPDGLTAGDFRAPTSAAGLFDWTYNHALNPGANSTQRNASVTTLFYLNNWLHDWWYDTGFDEAAGNAQTSNFGRGGLGADAILAEGQDYGGTNNANMATPADGGAPRMQMYVFNPAGGVTFNVGAPAAIAGAYYAGSATFGPQTFSISGTVVAATDAVAPTTDGCSAITNSVTGKIALIDRGTCTNPTKVLNAQAAGAIAVILVNNVSGQAFAVTGSSASVTIPVISLSLDDGAALRNQLTLGNTVTVSFSRAATVQRDGTIDGHIVAHEWMHYMSNRLVGDGSGLSSQQAGGMGEGWSDFNSLLMVARPGDDLQGVYAMAPYALSNSAAASNVYYYGIRRYPYSVQFSRNPLTFRHIQDGTALPAGPPINGDITGATNSEVHRTGEVWCAMLWECFVALASDTPRLTFEQARERMKSYVLGGLQLTPNAPTITEARDAILAAAYANDPTDFVVLAQAFARRGCGTGAVSPPRASLNNVGVVESYAVGGDLAVTQAVLDDALYSCDSDSYLDNHERARLTVTIANVGTTTLGATTLSVISTNPHASFPDGNTFNVAPTAPFTTRTLVLPVDLSGATPGELLEVYLSVDDPGLVTPGPRTVVVRDWLHVDETTSATDGAETHHTSWTPGGYGGDPWQTAEVAAGSHAYHVNDAGGIAELTFTTAPLTVSTTDPLVIGFDHRWSFEYDSGADYDGGVIELSNDGGATWTDVGASVSPGYTGTMFAGSGNPLGGRAAWTKQSAGYPATIHATLSLGTTYAGQTVRLRFKHAADAGVGAPGWWVDNIAVSGITNAPFLALTPELGACAPLAADGEPLPDRVALSIAGTHPARGMAQLKFALPTAAVVRLTVHDLAGRTVAALADGGWAAGRHTVSFARTPNGEAPAAGVYFARLVVDGRAFTQRLVLLH